MKVKTNGGQGGKRGHSNMEHRDFSSVVKSQAKKARREENKRRIREYWDEVAEEMA